MVFSFSLFSPLFPSRMSFVCLCERFWSCAIQLFRPPLEDKPVLTSSLFFAVVRGLSAAVTSIRLLYIIRSVVSVLFFMKCVLFSLYSTESISLSPPPPFFSSLSLLLSYSKLCCSIPFSLPTGRLWFSCAHQMLYATTLTTTFSLFRLVAFAFSVKLVCVCVCVPLLLR